MLDDKKLNVESGKGPFSYPGPKRLKTVKGVSSVVRGVFYYDQKPEKPM